MVKSLNSPTLQVKNLKNDLVLLSFLNEKGKAVSGLCMPKSSFEKGKETPIALNFYRKMRDVGYPDADIEFLSDYFNYKK